MSQDTKTLIWFCVTLVSIQAGIMYLTVARIIPRAAGICFLIGLICLGQILYLQTRTK